jgi:hypothetical protein
MRQLIIVFLLSLPFIANAAITIRRTLRFHDFKDKENSEYRMVERTVTPNRDGTFIDIQCSGNGMVSCPKNIVHKETESYSEYPQDILLFAQNVYDVYCNQIQLNEGNLLPSQSYSVSGENNKIYSIILTSEINTQGDVTITMILN